VRVTILGSGGSGGVPIAGLGWGACDPANPRNRRLRPSILVEHLGTSILVDTSPDLRQQLLAAGVSRLDAVLYTHAHADHLHGIDDLRGINRAMGRALPAYATEAAWDGIRRRFGYALEPPAAGHAFYKPALAATAIAAGDVVSVGAVRVAAIDQDHGFSRTLGFRFGPIAYSTDAVELPDTAFAALAGVDTWIVGALTDAPHPTHAHVAKALGWIDRVRPRRAVLTHLGFDLDYDTLGSRLPPGVEAAFDGLVVEALGD
jgi:phosphoribosyl 1,2-cyclic phosphate phosphodiesterase